MASNVDPKTTWRSALKNHIEDTSDIHGISDTSVIEADITQLQADIAAMDVSETYVYNVKFDAYGAVGDGSADDTAAIQEAMDDAYAAGGGVVYLPAGIYKITDPITSYQPVSVLGDGSYSTQIKLFSSDAKVMFDGGTHGGRGGISGRFRINMNETGLTGYHGYRIVNRSFEDIRVDSPAAGGTAMLLDDCQNNDFDGVDLEAKGGGEGPDGTRGLVFDLGSSGNNFYGFRCNEFMGPHVSYRQSAVSPGSGVDKPRHNWLWGVMIERTTTSTSNGNTPYLIYHKAGDNNGICGGNISATTDDADPGVTQTICYHDNSGDYNSTTATRMIYRDLKINGELFSGTRRSLAFDFSGTFFYGVVENCTVGNVEYMMQFNNEGSHCVREDNNFVDEIATARYTGSSAYMRAGFASSTSGTLNPRRGQICYFYAGGSSDLTNVEPYVNTGFIIAIQFYASRLVKHGTGNIYLSGGVDMSATANDMLYLIHDGAGNFHEVSRVVK